MDITKLRYFDSYLDRRTPTLYIWAFDDNDQLHLVKDKWRPTLYMRTFKQGSPLMSLDGYSVEPVDFDNIYDYKNALKEVPEDEQKMVHQNNFVPPEIPRIAELFPSVPDKPIQPRKLYFDIEVHSDKGFPTPERGIWPITACAFYRAWQKSGVVYGLKSLPDKYRGPDGNYWLQDGSQYICTHGDEILLIAHILGELKQGHIFLGWNSNQYDIPYIHKRCEVLARSPQTKKHEYYGLIGMGLKAVSDIEDAQVWSKWEEKLHRQKWFIKIPGKGLVDLMEMYQKFTRISLQSYSLDFVGKFEFGEGKLKAYGEGNKELTLSDMFYNHWDTYITYNERDVTLTKDIDEKRGLSSLACEWCSSAGIPVDRVVYMSAVLDGALLRFLRPMNFVAPGHFVGHQEEKVKGGFVKEPIAVWGKKFYQHTTCLDVTSEYPSVIVKNNISPETFIGRLDLPFFNYVDPSQDDRTPHDLHPSERPYVSDETMLNPTAALCTDIIEALPKSGPVTLTRPDKDIQGDMVEVIEKLRTKEWNICGDGTLFKNHPKGAFSSFIEDGFRQRKVWKRKFQKHRDLWEAAGSPEESEHKAKMNLYNTRQLGWKLLLNSSYGQLASRYNRLFNRYMAGAITSTGQCIVMNGERFVNQFFSHGYQFFEEEIREVCIKHGKPAIKIPFWDINVVDRVTTMDTDSAIFSVDDMVFGFYGEFGEDKPDYTEFIKDMIGIVEGHLNEYLNEDFAVRRLCATDPFQLGFEHEAEKISDGALFLGKKKYIIRRPDHSYKITGFEVKKVNLCEGIRESLQGMIDLVMEKGLKWDMYEALYDVLHKAWELHTELSSGTPQEVAYRMSYSSSVNKMEKYFCEEGIFKKSTPLHVKGSLIHNYLVKELNLPYNDIYSGDRVRVLKIIPPRPKYTSICFKEEMPKEFITDFKPNIEGIIKTDFLQKVEKLVGAFNWARILTNLLKILNKKEKGWMTREVPLTFDEIKAYIDEMIKGS